MKWNNLKEIFTDVWVLRINNLKVNRIKSGSDEGKYIRTVPMTKGLKNLLLEMGLNEKNGSNDYLLDRQNRADTNYMMTSISRGFSHFIKQVTDEPIQFKSLKKTYITMLSIKLGDKAKMFTGHESDKILKDHYISNEYLAGSLNEFEIFK